MYERIVVPQDGSAVAEQAIPQATALARLAGAPIHLLRVVDPTLFVPGGFGRAYPSPGAWQMMLEAEQAEHDAAVEDLARIAAPLKEEGLTVTTEVLHGAVVPALLAEMRPGDVVVMATHGRGGLSRWFLGSTAEAVLRQSWVPVMLVRVRAAEEAAASDA